MINGRLMDICCLQANQYSDMLIKGSCLMIVDLSYIRKNCEL